MFENQKSFWGKCKRGDAEFYGLLRWSGYDIYTEIDPTSPLFEEMKKHHDPLTKKGHNGYKIYESHEDMESDSEVELMGSAIGILGIGTSGFNGRVYKKKMGTN